MSFILDALKKSELDRQRQSSPGLADAGLARPRAGLPAWAIALCVLLAINLVVLLFVLLRGVFAPQAAVTPQPAAAASPVASAEYPAGGSPDRADHFSPLDPAPTYAPEIPVEAGVPTPGVAISGRRTGGGASGVAAGTRSSAVPNARAATRADPILNDDDYKAADEEVLPTVNEISLSGAQALPELHLDVHVFATRPADRFVYVNMRKYHEGATLQEGPTIERIRRDGVILNYQGLRFLLPRQ
jgi:general secretion pathway protein B